MRLPKMGKSEGLDPELDWESYSYPYEDVLARLTPDRLTGRSKPLLDKTAWVMQELLLAPRILRYEKERLKFACWKGESTENQPENKHPVSNFQRKFELFRVWRRTFQRYTDLAITMQHDILPGIGGLAGRFGALAKGRYAAGLWIEDLHCRLLWRVRGENMPGKQRFQPVSWSWASVSLTSIRYDLITDGPWEEWLQDWLEILKVEVPLASSNSFGEAKGGMLHVSGYLRNFGKGPRSSGVEKNYEYKSCELVDSTTSEMA
ncbi:hypothetical protein ACLOAV_001914 [Pseudogymnoascus australis]